MVFSPFPDRHRTQQHYPAGRQVLPAGPAVLHSGLPVARTGLQAKREFELRIRRPCRSTHEAKRVDTVVPVKAFALVAWRVNEKG